MSAVDAANHPHESTIGVLELALAALQAGDEEQYRHLLTSLAADTTRPALVALGQLARELSQVLGELPAPELDAAAAAGSHVAADGDAHAALAELPDVCARLRHVVTMTEQAAHRTLDLVDHSREVVAVLAQRPLESESAVLVAQLRADFSELELAQSYQDLTGQTIRRVVDIVERVQLALAELFPAAMQPQSAVQAALGPAVPGVDRHTTNQNEADELFAGLGL